MIQGMTTRSVGVVELPYGVVGGERLMMDVYAGGAWGGAGASPAVVVVHGGGWSSGDKRADLPFIPALVGAGLACFSINYRLAPAHPWPACLEDVRAAMGWLQDHGHAHGADPGRIVMVGYSAGAHLALLAGLEASAAVVGMIGLAAPTDQVWDNFRRGGLSPSMLGLFPAGRPSTAPATGSATHPAGPPAGVLEELWQTSPVNHLTPKSPPCLLVHGTADTSVPHALSEHYLQRCRDLGVRCELVTLEGKTHRIATWSGYEERMVQFVRSVG